MTKSEKPSLVFLKTSFTQRERLTPEIACSTLTRTLEILRLRSFSLAVNSFLRGFFRLTQFADLRLVPLKTRVFMQGDMFWVRDILCIGHVLIVRFAGVRLAEIGNAFFLGGRNDHILIRMDFLLTAVKKCLFFRVFWPLAASFRTINDRIGRIGAMFLFGLELLWISFWHHAQIVQGLLQDRQ